MSDSLQAIADKAIAQGPDRVVVDGAGTALPPARAKEQGVVPRIIFIREDGWTLGAPEHLAKVAEATWHDVWIGFVKRPSKVARPLNVSDHTPSADTPCPPPHAA